MPPNKSIKIFINYFLGPLLAVWLGFSIYRQIVQQPHLEASWIAVKRSFSSSRVLLFAGAVLLVVANWGIEARKWQLSVRSIHPVSFGKAFKAVLSGVSFAVSTPNRMGEYLGRMLFLPDGFRLRSISVTLVGSIGQLLITLYAGFAALMVLKNALTATPYYSKVLYQFALFGVGAGAFFLTIFYFETGALGRLLNKWLRKTRYRYLIESLEAFSNRLLLQLLLLSALRYAVFVLQYLLLFRFFGVQVGLWEGTHALGMQFLTMAVIPSIALAEVGLRGEISLTLLGLFSTNSLGIGLTTVSIWFLNLVIPAVAGTGLILSVRFFNKQNEKD